MTVATQKTFIGYMRAVGKDDIIIVKGPSFYEACKRLGMKDLTNTVAFYTDRDGPRYVRNGQGEWERGKNFELELRLEKLFEMDQNYNKPPQFDIFAA